MADVTLIGLGPLGTAMARALIGTGYDTVVWNRTAARAAPLLESGATTRETAAQAVAASPVVLVCVTDYAASEAILDTPEVRGALDGKVLVQLSTGSPRQARQSAEWATACGALFLAGHVQAYPREIGHRDTSILLSGSEPGYARCEPPLRALAPALSYLGSDPGGALIMALAITLASLAARCGVMAGMAVCEGAGLSREQFAQLAGPYMTRGIGSSFQDAFALDDPAFKETQASMAVWKKGLPRAMEAVADSGCDVSFVRCCIDLIDRAVALGWEDVGIAALSKSMLGRKGPARVVG